MNAPLNLAVFCDYENLAIGAREAKLEDFYMDIALERLLDKGKIVFKKAYADWDRYKGARKELHEHAFELVEVPHVSYSGKNSADIRLVVDALDLCYTKSHVDTFAILSGDSDFSPLVSKLRENNKTVIGLGVKNSSSSLLIENCDEFFYYDELVQSRHRGPTRAKQKADKNSKNPKDTKEEAMRLVLSTIEILIEEREGTLWGPTVRRAIKRKRPNFSEAHFGFKNFNEILEEGKNLGLLKIAKDVSTGNYAILSVQAKDAEVPKESL